MQVNSSICAPEDREEIKNESNNCTLYDDPVKTEGGIHSIEKKEDIQAVVEIIEPVDDRVMVIEPVSGIAMVSNPPRLVPLLIPSFWFSEEYKTSREVLETIKKRIRNSIKYFQPFPSTLQVGNIKVRANWHKVKMPFVPKHLFDIIVPLQVEKLQPTPTFRPTSKVTLLVIKEQAFAYVFGWHLQEFHKPIAHHGFYYTAKIPTIYIKHSTRTNKLELLYIVDIYNNNGGKMLPQINLRQLRAGRIFK